MIILIIIIIYIYIYFSLFLCFSPDSYYIDSLNHFHKNFDHGFFDRRYDHSRRRNFSFFFFFLSLFFNKKEVFSLAFFFFLILILEKKIKRLISEQNWLPLVSFLSEIGKIHLKFFFTKRRSESFTKK